MKGRVLAALLAAIAVVALLVIVGRTGSGDSAAIESTPGQPWAGPTGVTESVAKLASRQRARDRRGIDRVVGVREKPEPPEEAVGGGSEQSSEEQASGEQSAATEEESGGPQKAGGERAASGGAGPGEKPVPGEPEARPRAQAQALPLARLGKAAIEPKSSFSAGTSFLGAQRSDSGFIPPDSMGSVGPDQALVDVNGRVRVFDKSGGHTGTDLDVTDSTFWASVDGGEEPTDPGVEYDRLSGRWIVSAINTANTNNLVMIAVSDGPHINSTSSTDTSSFTFFAFPHNGPIPAHSGQFADYPQLGVDANAVYIGVNDFLGNNYSNSSVFVIQKSSLLAGGPLTVTGFTVASGFGPGPSSPQPATDMDPTVANGYVVGADNQVFNRLDVRRITDPGGTPSISGNLAVTVPSTSLPLNVPAQGTHNTLDALDDRLFEAMVGRGPDGSDSLWTAHNIAVNSSGIGTSSGDRDAARWYQLGDLASNPPTLVQSGTLFDTSASNARFFWMPSIAMNGQGHASLNSSTAGAGRFAEVVASGRLAGDPSGTTESPDTVKSSSSTYDLNPQSGFAANKRWGDYSRTVVDPTDDQTFWTFQEYPNSNNSWAVQVIQLKAPPPAIPESVSPDTVSSSDSSANVTITGTSTKGSGFFDPGANTGFQPFNHIQAAVGGGVIVNSVTYTDPTHVTLNLNVTGASPGPQPITITNPDGQTSDCSNALVVDSDSVPPPTPNLQGTTPSSPGNSTSPLIFGTNAECGSRVDLYDDLGCSHLVATGNATKFASPGILASVSPNSTTTFYAKDTDVSNNQSDCSVAPNTVNYVEDSTPPVASVDSGPNGVTTDARPTFTFSATDSFPPSDTITFQCSIDTGAASFGSCSGPGNSDTPSSALADGSYTFRVQATDAAGNTSQATRAFSVQVPPDTTITKGPKKKTTKRRPKFKFTSTQGVSTFQCKVDKGQFASCASPFTPPKLRLGKHVLRVRAIGPTGVADPAPAVRKFTVVA